MAYEREILHYISTLKSKAGNPMREKDKVQVKNVLTAFCRNLSSWPNETDYQAYIATIADKPKRIKDDISRIKNFFAWINSEKERDNMTDNETIPNDATPNLFPVDTNAETSQPADDEATAPIEPEISEEVITGDETAQPENETTKVKRERKKGEKRIQVSVYLNPDIYEGIKLMAGNMGATISDILEVFAGKFVERNHDAIQEMKTAWDKVKSTVIFG